MKNTKKPKQTITIDGMSLYELCRWAALKDAIDIIGDKCDERKIVVVATANATTIKEQVK